MVVPTLGLLYVPEAEVLLTVSLMTVVVGVRLTGNWAKRGLHEIAVDKKTKIRKRRCTIFSYENRVLLRSEHPGSPLSADGTEFAAAPILPADGNKTVVPEMDGHHAIR